MFFVFSSIGGVAQYIAFTSSLWFTHRWIKANGRQVCDTRRHRGGAIGNVVGMLHLYIQVIVPIANVLDDVRKLEECARPLMCG